MKHQLQRAAWAIGMMLAVSTLTTGCSQETSNDVANSQTAQASSEQTNTKVQAETTKTEESSDESESNSIDLSSRAVYDNDDIAETYDSFDAEITLNKNSASVNGNKESVTVADGNIEITKGGVYYLTGTLEDGQINVIGKEKVKLYLDDVSIKNSNGAAIVCTNEKRTIITLAEGSENTISDGKNYSIPNDDTTAAIYAKDSLTINGSGILTITSSEHDCIVSKDNLKITGGVINANAGGNALKGTDSVSICGGFLNITSENDAIKSTKQNDNEKGWIAIDGGEINITAGGDGIQAENTLEITSGKLNINTNGEIDTSFSDNLGEMPKMPDMKNMPDMQDAPDIQDMPNMPDMPDLQNVPDMKNENDDTTEETFSISSKGIKSGNALSIKGGTIKINSTDHCIHSSSDMNISNGTFELYSSLAKGISSYGELTISGNETLITIEKCTEGIESKSVMNINNGNIRILNASDDGLNTGGNESNDHTMNINGGTIYINTTSDGTDSNGNTNFNGGTLIILGPTSGADGSIDGDGNMTLNGTTLLALSSKGMMEYPAGCMITTSANISANDMVSVLDNDGKLILTVKANKDFSDIIYADNTGENMASYKLITGGTFDGILCNDNWSADGKISDGTEGTWSQAQTASESDPGGFKGRNDNDFPDENGAMPHDDMIPPEGFNGEPPHKPDKEYF